jgi:hypothetical protein
MAEKRTNETQPADADRTEAGALPPALPPATRKLPSDSGSIDVTGIVPEDIRIDPDITEGHPGYEESGDSEIIPLERLVGQKDAEGGK